MLNKLIDNLDADGDGEVDFRYVNFSIGKNQLSFKFPSNRIKLGSEWS